MNKIMLMGMVIGISIGAILFGGLGVAAVTLSAKDVTFTPTNSSFKASNTQDAINELYNIAINNSQSVVYLGTGTSFNLSSYSGYQNFTANNFIVGVQSGTGSGQVYTKVGLSGGGSASTHVYMGSFSVSKSYNASTGVLTVSAPSTGLSVSTDQTLRENSAVQTYTAFAYLVY